MREILSIIAIPLSGIITYVLGLLAGKRKERASQAALELNNYQQVVDFYKNTFEDLNKEIKQLHTEIAQLREENKSLRAEVHALNEKLQFLKDKPVE